MSVSLAMASDVPAGSTAPAAAGATSPVMRQLLLDLGPERPQTLASYVAGHNADVVSWLTNWPPADQPPSPVYLWGPGGSGKTHLLRALLARALAQGWGAIWLAPGSCQMWEGHTPDAPTLALLDDCGALHSDEQHLAFNLFIESAGSASRPAEEGGAVHVAAAGLAPPVDLPVRDDLRTRLGWGWVFQLMPLGETEVRRVLAQEAERRGLSLPDEVLNYLFARHSRDLGALMRLLDQLDAYALSAHRPVTVPLVRQVLSLETP